MNFVYVRISYWWLPGDFWSGQENYWFVTLFAPFRIHSMNINRQDLEAHRGTWSNIAKEHNWHQEPFYVQVWVNNEGTIVDSTSVRGLNKDYIISYDTDEEITDFNLV